MSVSVSPQTLVLPPTGCQKQSADVTLLLLPIFICEMCVLQGKMASHNPVGLRDERVQGWGVAAGEQKGGARLTMLGRAVCPGAGTGGKLRTRLSHSPRSEAGEPLSVSTDAHRFAEPSTFRGSFAIPTAHPRALTSLEEPDLPALTMVIRGPGDQALSPRHPNHQLHSTRQLPFTGRLL